MKTKHKWTKGEYKIATNPNCTIECQTDTRKGYTLTQVSRSAPPGLPAKEWHFPVFGIEALRDLIKDGECGPCDVAKAALAAWEEAQS